MLDFSLFSSCFLYNSCVPSCALSLAHVCNICEDASFEFGEYELFLLELLSAVTFIYILYLIMISISNIFS